MQNPNSFRNGIIAVIVVFLVTVIGFVIYTATLPFNLVSKNYYAEEIAYQEQIERIERANALPEPIEVSYDNTGGLTIRFPAYFEPASVQGTITLFRPSDKRLDRHFPINLNRDGRQYIAAEYLPIPGLWKIKISWSSEGLEYYWEKEFIKQ